MNDKDLFPDYEPKKTPDTIHDYLKNPENNIFRIMKKIGNPSLNKLPLILDYFNQFQKKAKKSPGSIRNGNVAIGADPNQYYPSEEELLVSELGKMILFIIESNSKSEIENYKRKMKIKSQTVEYNEISFRHVDVMGSGRYFYAEKRNSITHLRL